MEVYQSKESIQQALFRHKSDGKTVGFVPTMGALHEGHFSLIRCSTQQNDITVVSVFVNPTQFNQRSDYEKYPRDLSYDLKILEDANCDIAFTPSEKEMYPEKDTRVFDFGKIDKVMEGKHRPGHFNGVAQVVSKLFEIVSPDRAYFGEKDFQQLVIIRKLVEKLNMDIEIVPCSIIREESGLAMSSRNERLSDEERKNAAIISETLFQARKMAGSSGVEEVKKWVTDELNKNSYINVEYFEIVNEKNFEPISAWNETFYKRACIAAWAGNVRLIDNVKFYF